MAQRLNLQILPQPDDQSCGVTCLNALYSYYKLDISLERLLAEVEHLDSGGTLAVMLACDALRRGFKARIYTYNLHLFDPTWFKPGVDIADRLRRQAAVKDDPKLQAATARYIEFLSLGGQIRFEDLNGALIRRYLSRGNPILAGLSSTFLYHTARETDHDFDDITGTAQGHFVVLLGYDPDDRHVRVADPLLPNPLTSDSHYYDVSMDRLIAAILLGIVTYDANLLIIEPKPGHTA